MPKRHTDQRLAALDATLKEYRDPGYQENIIEQFV